MTDDKSFLRQTLKEFEGTSKKLKELGKIMGKDLWVRAHSKETPLNNLKERLRWLK